MMLDISVVVPTRNRAQSLKKLLITLEKQTLSQNNYEILVIDNGSIDETGQLCADYKTKFCNFQYLYNENPGLHVGRNMGYLQSKSEIIVFADDDIEARLIGSLSPSPLDGVLSKASTLEIFHQELFLSLNGVRQATDRLNNQWYINQSRTLSPTEREILRFMSRGYSMTQIAEQLKRNIKTIRAHKFNVMSKLGVSSDAGLLEAADILLCMRHCEASNVLHPY